MLFVGVITKTTKRREKMKRIEKFGNAEIWQVKESWGVDFYVYSGGMLVRVCPSIGMAREIMAGL